jgi:hypothetical protein
MKKILSISTAFLLSVALISCSGTSPSPVDTEIEKIVSETLTTVSEKDTMPIVYTPAESTMIWDSDHILPTFSDPAETMDAVDVSGLSADELLFLSTLQGIVNRSSPRLVLLDNGDEGGETWPQTFDLSYTTATIRSRYAVYKKYLSEVSGMVLYSDELSSHYVNLACSVANTLNAVPVSESFLKTLQRNGIYLETAADLTDLPYTSPIDIYGYFYEHYWTNMGKRLLFTLSPNDSYHSRDLAAATGSAIVYFDCTNKQEKLAFQKFLGDMTAGESACIGFYSSERGGITTASSFGISTIPADLFCNGTVYATSEEVIIPAVQKLTQTPENKIYLAVYISDGDNLQYNQRYMRKLWDSTKGSRGKVAINWTISPALVDAAPGILNYYYSTATELDYFVCGPSGMGYTMPYNTLGEEVSVGNYMKDSRLFEAYTTLSEKYLVRAGLRVVTVWDDLTEEQREIYTSTAVHLYGITIQQWGQNRVTADSVHQGKYCTQLTPCYESSYEALLQNVKTAIGNWDGESALFLSCQISVWSSIKPASIVQFYQDLNALYNNQVEFVRADHYFALYAMENGLSYDLTLLDSVTVQASSNEEDASLILDGSPSTGSIWIAEEAGEQTLTFDLGGSRILTAYELYGLTSDLHWVAEVSDDQENWMVWDSGEWESDSWSYRQPSEVQTSYLRLRLTSSSDQPVRLADIDIWGQ